MTEDKKKCTCGQFMLLKPIPGEQFKQEWVCPWCDKKEPFEIQKPSNVVGGNINTVTSNKDRNGDDWSQTVGMWGRCIGKNFRITPEDNWKCVDIRISDEVSNDPALLHEYNTHLRNHGYIAVCRYCRQFKPDTKK